MVELAVDVVHAGETLSMDSLELILGSLDDVLGVLGDLPGLSAILQNE